MGGVAEDLGALEQLLRRYGHTGHAEDVLRLRRLYGEDQNAFANELDDRKMWGGAGSVCDAVPKSGVYCDLDQANADQTVFFSLIADLVDQLDHEGLASARAREVGRAYREIADRRSR